MITVIVIDGGKATVTEMEYDWHEISKIVGGHIEGVRFPVAQTIAYINEEGKLHDLPPNEIATAAMRGTIFPDDYIAGPMVVCGTHGSEEVSLSDEQVVAVIELLDAARMP